MMRQKCIACLISNHTMKTWSGGIDPQILNHE